jgi:hypothetical protein
VAGILHDAAQTKVEGATFGMHIFEKSQGQRDEYLKDLQWWLLEAGRYAAANYWPTRRSSCTMCQFRRVCALDPAYRQQELETNYVQKFWNPLEER